MNKTGFILTSITLSANLLTFLISLMIIIIIIHYILHNRLKHDDKMVLYLCTNIYGLLLILTAIMISFNTQTILGDLYGQDFQSLWCTTSGYLFAVFFGMLYWSFVNQVIMKQRIWISFLFD